MRENVSTFRTPIQHQRGGGCLVDTMKTCPEILLAKELAEAVEPQTLLGRDDTI